MQKNCASRIQVTVAFIFMVVACFTTALHAQTVTALYTYPNTSNNSSGIVPTSVFSQAQDGNLYNTIQTNGSANEGSVYQMTTAGQYSLIYSFCSEGGHCATTGANPSGGVTLGTDGELYGTTTGGGVYGDGTVFKVTSGASWTKLWDFTAGSMNDDGAPYYAPLQGLDGNFYGTDAGVYSGTYGVFYKITPKGQLTPYPFDYANGADPNLPAQGTDGNFYGSAQLGGDPTCRCGTIYKVTANGTISLLHAFKGYPNDGTIPKGILIQAGDGNFYGTTYEGGSNNLGTVFKISASGVLSIIHNFAGGGTDGSLPQAGLILGTDGNMYGVTGSGGVHNYGTIFQVTTAGGYSLLYNFCSLKGCIDGIYPVTALIQHTNGKFYGNASGNSLCCSTFYSLDMGLSPFARLVNWTGKVGKTVEILGQGFTGATKVSFNGTAATFKVVSDTYLTATVPTGATTGFITVATSGGTLKSNRKFLVTPQVLSFDPPSGPVGTTVTITGVSLTQSQGVGFGNRVGAKFTVNSDTQITATVPSGAITGPVGVLTPGGTGISTSSFTVTQ